MGTLRISGIIDRIQFWPLGSSDADTTKIKLEVNEDSFTYQEEGDDTFYYTNVFEDAISRGQGSKPVISTSKKTGVRTIIVRLQGIDAPELHYRAAPLKRSPDVTDAERKKFNKINEERRQYYAESSTVALSKHLKQFADSTDCIPAIFETRIDFPFEAVDTYGRFVGNIFVDDTHDINIWLIENGWGLPAFYTSMSAEEINASLSAWSKGKNKTGRPAKASSVDVNTFDWDLLYRSPSTVSTAFKLGDDKGRVLMPKIYRRQVAWMVSKKAGVVSKSMSFATFLKRSPDQLVLLDDFLANTLNSATVLNLHEFISADNKVKKKAEELVFKEKPSTLVNKRGKKLTEWF